MSLRQLSSREKRIAVLCILVVGVFLGYQSVFLPLKEHSDVVETDIKIEEGKLRKQLNIIAKWKEYQKEYDRIITQFQQAGSDEKVMSMILAEIESVAGTVNLSITQMKPQRVKREEYYNNFSVSLSFNAPLKKIAEFLYYLQGEEHAFAVDQVRLDKISPRHPDLRCQLVISKIRIP